MFGRKFERFATGKVIKAEALNAMQAALEWLLNIGAAAPLDLQHGASGPQFRWAGPGAILHGRAATNFTGRSGTAFGFGMVTPGQNDAGTFRSTPNVPNIKVWNDLTAGPLTGAYVKYAIVDGEATLITAECSP